MADPGSLSDIIDVTITLADAEVQRDGFSGVMLVSEHEVGSPDRVQTYTGKKADVLAAMVADGFALLRVSAAHAETAPNLAMHHCDPFDRMLVAQAQCEALTLVSADRQLLHYAVELSNARL